MKYKVVLFCLILLFLDAADLLAKGRDSFIGVHDVGINLSPMQYKELSDIGISIARSNAVVWNRVEKKKGEFDFTQGDYTYLHASKNNIDLVFTLMAPPKWARDKNAFIKGPPYLAMTNDLAGWANYCRAVMQHFKGKVMYWEVWNEQNAPKAWFKRGTPAQFVKLMKIAYTTAKEVDVNNKVVMGGVVGPEIEKAHQGEGFFEETLKLGISDWLDIYAVHYTASNWNKYYWFKGLIRKYGDTSKPTWNTEESYKRQDRNPVQVLLVDHYLQGMDKVFYYVVQDPAGLKPSQERRGVFDRSGHKRWIYHKLNNFASFTIDKHYVSSSLNEVGGVFYFKKNNIGDVFYAVAWHPESIERKYYCSLIPSVGKKINIESIYYQCKKRKSSPR